MLSPLHGALHGTDHRRTHRTGELAIELALSGEAVGHWDRGRIEQVVENLLGNAIKYGGGKPIHIEVTADPERARLVVRDQGIGIEAEALPRIFDKRASSARQRGATFVVELPLRR